MAKDELLFESERLEQRQQRKRLLLPLAIAGLVILAILAVIVIVQSGKGETYRGGEDTPYPYSWTQNRDGSVRLELTHKDAPQERWQFQPGETITAMEIQRAEKESGGSTVFNLTPVQPGRALIRLVLAPEGKQLSARYVLNLLAETLQGEEGMSVIIRSSEGVSLAGDASGADETDHPYRVYTDWDGDTVIAVRNVQNSADWEFTVDNEDAVLFLGLQWSDDQMAARLRPGEQAGEATVLLQCESAGIRLEIKLQRTEDGGLQVLSHKPEYREVEASEDEPYGGLGPNGTAAVETEAPETSAP